MVKAEIVVRQSVMVLVVPLEMVAEMHKVVVSGLLEIVRICCDARWGARKSSR